MKIYCHIWLLILVSIPMASHAQVSIPDSAFYALSDSLSSEYTRNIEYYWQHKNKLGYEVLDSLLPEMLHFKKHLGKRTEVEKAYYKIIKAYIKNKLGKRDTAMVIMSRNLDEYSGKDKEMNFIMQLYYTRILYGAQLYGNGRLELERLKYLISTLPKIPPINRSRLYAEIGRKYGKSGWADSAIHYNRLSVANAQIAGRTMDVIDGYKNISMGYYGLQQYDSALHYAEWSIREYLNHPELGTINYYFALYWKARSLAALKEEDNAIPLYEQLLDSLRNFRHTEYYGHAAFDLSMLYSHKGKWNEADALIKEAETLDDQYDHNFSKYRIPLNKAAYARMTWYETQGMMDKAMDWMQIGDSIQLAQNRQQMEEMEHNIFIMNKIKLEKLSKHYRLEKKASEALTRQNRFKAALIISIILFGALLFYLLKRNFMARTSFLQKQNQLETTEKELVQLKLVNEQLEKDKLAHEINQKKKDITDLALDITARNQISKDIIEQLDKIDPKDVETTKKQLHELSLFLNSNLINNESRAVLTENIAKVNHEFYNNLNAAHGDLTNSEKEFCGLIRLGLSGKDIASILNLSEEAIKKRRHRLRKKLQINSNADIAQYLEKF